ncbi:hypothetical protein PLESTF_000567300 [Pleodorina starrii]|nr:hypothetical protein PLESTF_000567300 [Pleodorina starrii]
MCARKSEYGAGGAPAHLPGKQVRLRPAVRAGALYRHPAWNHPSIMERKLDKLLKNQAEMLKNQAEMLKNQAEMQKSIAQLTTDTAVNKALVAVNLTPAASLVLGVLYFVYNNFSGGG